VQASLVSSLTRGVTRLYGARGRRKFGAPMFETKVFRSKCTVLKKVLVILLGIFGAPRSDSAPRELCPPCYAPEFNTSFFIIGI